MATGGNEGLYSNDPILVWDVEDDFDIVASLKGPTYEVGSISFSPDGRWLLSASGDGSNRIWDCEDEYECANARSQALGEGGRCCLVAQRQVDRFHAASDMLQNE